MHYVKNQEFINKIMPVITHLAQNCFDPSENFACTFCSLNSGRHDKHCNNCLYYIGQKILVHIIQIDSSDEYNLDFKKNMRTQQEIKQIKNSYKVDAILNGLKDHLNQFILLDKNDPSDENICCTCNVFSGSPDHAENCEVFAIADSLSLLFSNK